jgi:hypothetical protein
MQRPAASSPNEPATDIEQLLLEAGTSSRLCGDASQYGLLFLYDDPALSVREHSISGSVLAGRKVVVLPLPNGADDLTTRLPVERDHGGEILQDRCVLRAGQGRCAEERRHHSG